MVTYRVGHEQSGIDRQVITPCHRRFHGWAHPGALPIVRYLTHIIKLPGLCNVTLQYSHSTALITIWNKQGSNWKPTADVTVFTAFKFDTAMNHVNYILNAIIMCFSHIIDKKAKLCSLVTMGIESSLGWLVLPRSWTCSSSCSCWVSGWWRMAWPSRASSSTTRAGWTGSCAGPCTSPT